MRYNLVLICITGLLLTPPATAFATDYHVGPGQTYTTIGAVPWYTLAEGDTVYIHYAIYHEKFLVSTRGTAQNPIRVIGVLDSNGNRPVIDGQNATTSTNNHHHWQDASGSSAVQWDGVVFISINSDAALLPAYIEIKNLEIKNGYKTYNFTAENGATSAYDGFAAGIYIRSAEHILIENCVIHDNGQGIYSWTGSGSNWWDGLSKDIILRGNYFYNNGQTSSYTEHQTYTEADGVIIEYNHYGPQRAGAWGSHLKDRSAGTVIRYNYFDSAPSGWVIDLVEPEGAWDALSTSNKYRQAFVYGNVIINDNNHYPNYFHWNEDHQMGRGRTTLTGGKLFFYDNTVLTIANQSDMASFHYFNTTWGAYDCPTGSLPGVIDIRNNIFSVLPRTAGQSVPTQQFAYCNNQNLNFGVNWVSPGWVTNTTSGMVAGTANLYSPAANYPGFVSSSSPYDLHLTSSSDARNKGGAPASEMTNNYLSLNLSPIIQYVVHQSAEARSGITSLGAFEYGTGSSLPVTHILTPSAGSNGTISPNTVQTVNDGSTVQFTITPSNGYAASVGGTCGGSLSATTYTTNAITADCTVIATFTAVPTYTIGGSISNLSGSTTLTDTNAGSVIASGSSFVLPNGLISGTSYNVTISSQPTGQICTVSNGSGTVGYASVTNISVFCVSSYTVGGSLSGFSGNGTVAIRNNGGDELHLASNGLFTFPTAFVRGSAYLVSIPTQPSGQTCSVSNGSGIISGASITNVAISCVNSGSTGKVPSTVTGVGVR